MAFGFFTSCETTDLAIPNEEVLLIDLKTPHVYKWSDLSDPHMGYVEFNCNEGPYQVIISGNKVVVNTVREIAEAYHYTGETGQHKNRLELESTSCFIHVIENPREYSESFKIVFR